MKLFGRIARITSAIATGFFMIQAVEGKIPAWLFGILAALTVVIFILTLRYDIKSLKKSS